MTEAFEQLFANFEDWMGWNIFLALIPCALSFILFAKRSPKRLPQNPMWWFGLIVFILFLPNAPYTLTDIIHFVDDIRATSISPYGIILVLIPQYVIFILLGIQCYVLSIINLIQYFGWIKVVKNPIAIELAINFICAIGVYWGRFNRLNSWYILTKPHRVIQDAISNLSSPTFFLGTILFFIIFTGLYYIFKWIDLAIVFYWRNRPNQLSA
jgi:uncharacterized membrane protein